MENKSGMNFVPSHSKVYEPKDEQSGGGTAMAKFPQNPGQMECRKYEATGECDYKRNCRYHHTLPRKPESGICSYYQKFGFCDFGKKCHYDHPPMTQHQAHTRPATQHQAQAHIANPDAENRPMTMTYTPVMAYPMAMAAPAVGTLPLRPGVDTCVTFLKNGTCFFGSSCKFNHPPKAGVQHRDSYQSMLNVKPTPMATMQAPMATAISYVQPMPMQPMDRMAAMDRMAPVHGGGVTRAPPERYPRDSPEPERRNYDRYDQRYRSPPRDSERSSRSSSSRPECKNFKENGYCKYGADCHFAHDSRPPYSGLGQVRDLDERRPPRDSYHMDDRDRDRDRERDRYQMGPRSSQDNYGESSGRDRAGPRPIQDGYGGSSGRDWDEPSSGRPPAGMNGPPKFFKRKPGEKECSYYMKFAYCKFDEECKYDHPEWVLIDSIAKTLPQLPGRKPCQHFIDHKWCGYGQDCQRHHPTTEELKVYVDSGEKVTDEELDKIALALPQRPDTEACEFFMRHNWCGYGSGCSRHHPTSAERKNMDRPSKRSKREASPEKHKERERERDRDREREREREKKSDKSTKEAPVKPAKAIKVSVAAAKKPVSTPKKNVVCKVFLKEGSCPFGDTCKAVHPEKDGTGIKKLCKVFQKTGSCAFGATCKSLHARMENTES